ATFRSFESRVLPEAQKQGLMVFGMKSMGGSGEMVSNGGITPAEALSYAMSLPVTVTISGMESVSVLKQNLEIVRGFQPLTSAALQHLRDRCRPDAADCFFNDTKTTKKYDGDLGR